MKNATPGLLMPAELRSWRDSLPTLPRAPRFVSYCILNNELGNNAAAQVLSMCARMLCSLQLTTRPERPPLLLINDAVDRTQRQRLRRVGAELISVPSLGYNLSNLAWRHFKPTDERHQPDVLPTERLHRSDVAKGLRPPAVVDDLIANAFVLS